MNSPVIHIHQLAPWVTDLCASSEHPFVRDSAEPLRLFFTEDAAIPPSHIWKFNTDKSLESQILKAKTSKVVNELYWEDFARNCEAYSLMTRWRFSELLRSAIRTLNCKEIISAAVLARSLLELSASYLTNASAVSNTLQSIPPEHIEWVVSKELENLICKAIWGSRLAGTPDYVKQKNILTIIQKISKMPDASELYPKYEYLCELAHPNVIGNARFWSHVEKRYPDGSETREISRNALSDAVSVGGGIETVENIIWAIAWSAAVAFNSRHILEEAYLEFVKKL